LRMVFMTSSRAVASLFMVGFLSVVFGVCFFFFLLRATPRPRQN
jgi:hypothetical protein